ncbi:hypothetical protein F9C07_13306 [Aspergillus flavus]|uniref:Uncharacterized protein n=1 Tax=Aspergillus flavus (strain ATCC 200026 / FGSC A1120 / IAM 13836 / NRRL 3357 / JCM 12722 / SRRC 167) TaxID=332952 RepID=A0A7U2MZR7_ASPFN|nr:hypothetical protein F9C07_13306 [Aspergillus flavus]
MTYQRVKMRKRRMYLLHVSVRHTPACLATCADQPFGYAERDSRKDEAIVFIFIIATSGLLAWAVFKPWVQKYLEAARERRSYIPVSENADR